jgi:hypothetical protein
MAEELLYLMADSKQSNSPHDEQEEEWSHNS